MATLPSKDTATTANSHSTATFSKWGEVPRITIPSTTITYDKVFSIKK